MTPTKGIKMAAPALLLPIAALAFFGQPQNDDRGSGSPSSRYVEQLSVVPGRVSAAQRVRNTAMINGALARGITVRIHAGSRVEIASSLIVPSGGAIIGDPGTVKAEIFLPAAHFSNRDDSAGGGRYARSAVGINFSGSVSDPRRATDAVRLENIAIHSDPAMGRRLRGVVGQNVRNCTLRNVEVSGIPTGVGIALASARSCTLTDIYVHDFRETQNWQTRSQSTGIEIDNDIVGGVPSTAISIRRFKIANIIFGGAVLTKWGFETDGINIVGAGSKVAIADGKIDHVGEGIDTFGSDGTIRNVTINEAYIFGLKFVHGASRNIVSNVTITNAGLSGVTFSGSDQAAQDTVGNVITGLKISNIDPHGAWRANGSSGISVSGNKSRRVPRDNRVIDARIDLGPNGKYGWVDGSTGSNNRGTHIDITGGAALDRYVLVQRGGGSVESGRRDRR
jgi:hypothetical protein